MPEPPGLGLVGPSRELHGTVLRMHCIDDEATGLDVAVAHELQRRVYRGARDVASLQLLVDLFPGEFRQDLQYDPVHLRHVGATVDRVVELIARQRLRPPQPVHEPVPGPRLGVGHEDVHEAVAAAVDGAGGGEPMLRAVPARVHPRGSGTRHHVLHRREAVHHRDVDLLPRAALPHVPQCYEDGQGGVGRAHQERLRTRRVHRRRRRLAAHVHEPAHGEGHQLGPAVPAVGPGLAESRDGRVDQPRVRREQILVPQPHTRQGPGHGALHHHVRVPGQAPDALPPRLGIEVRGDALLVGVEVEEREATVGSRPVVLERRLAAGRTAPGRLHLDHLGAEVRQELAAVLALGARQFQDPHAIQRLWCSLRLRHGFDTYRLSASFDFARRTSLRLS